MTKRSSLFKIVAVGSLLVFGISVAGCSKKGGRLSAETEEKLIEMCGNIKKQMEAVCPIPQMQSLLTDTAVQAASSHDASFPLTLDCLKNVSVLVEHGVRDAEDLPSPVDSCIKMHTDKDQPINCIEVNLCMTAMLTKNGKMASDTLAKAAKKEAERKEAERKKAAGK